MLTFNFDYMNVARKKCLECKTEIIGRSDKIFCSDYCRASNHNRKNHRKIKLVREINQILSINRKILSDFHKRKIELVSKDDLIAAGYRFKFQTGWYENEKGLKISKCYDFAFEKISPDSYKIYKSN